VARARTISDNREKAARRTGEQEQNRPGYFFDKEPRTERPLG